MLGSPRARRRVERAAAARSRVDVVYGAPVRVRATAVAADPGDKSGHTARVAPPGACSPTCDRAPAPDRALRLTADR